MAPIFSCAHHARDLDCANHDQFMQHSRGKFYAQCIQNLHEFLAYQSLQASLLACQMDLALLT